MTKLTVLRGVSGSGKSTWARTQDAIVVSRDLVRTCLFGSESMENEELVTKVEHDMIRHALRADKDVISDNTNVTWKFAKAIADIGYAEGAEVELKVFDVSLETCLRRNAARANDGGRFVPRDVILKQHNRLQANKHFVLEPQEVIPYAGTPNRPDAFMVDLDGTLAHMDRSLRGPFDWAKVGTDTLDQVVADVVNYVGVGAYESNAAMKVIVMSGRSAECSGETIDWLRKHNILYDHLIMRAAGDNRPDNIVKHELFNEFVRDNFNVRFVIDDRSSVVHMWKKMGLKVFNVAGLDNGEF